jgi:hypothetical protein
MVRHVPVYLQWYGRVPRYSHFCILVFCSQFLALQLLGLLALQFAISTSHVLLWQIKLQIALFFQKVQLFTHKCLSSVLQADLEVF